MAEIIDLPFGACWSDNKYGISYRRGTLLEKVVFHGLRLGGPRLARVLSRLWLVLGRLFGFRPNPIDNLVWLAVGGTFVLWSDLSEL